MDIKNNRVHKCSFQDGIKIIQNGKCWQSVAKFEIPEEWHEEKAVLCCDDFDLIDGKGLFYPYNDFPTWRRIKQSTI